jgi:hypothetical protein
VERGRNPSAILEKKKNLLRAADSGLEICIGRKQ